MPVTVRSRLSFWLTYSGTRLPKRLRLRCLYQFHYTTDKTIALKKSDLVGSPKFTCQTVVCPHLLGNEDVIDNVASNVKD